MDARTVTVVALVGATLLAGCGHHAGARQPVATSSAATAASPTATATGSSWAPIGTAAPNEVPAGRAGAPRGGVQHPNLTDPNSVARAVAITQATWDSRLDNSPQDAARRAAEWMVPAMAQRNRLARTAGGDTWWQQMTAARGWTTATATEWAPTTGKGNQRQVTLLLAITAHGTTLPDQHQLLILTLTAVPATPSAPAKPSAPATAAKASAQPSTPAKPSTPVASSWLVSQISYLPAT